MNIEIKHYSAEFPEYDRSIIREVPREYGSIVPDMKNAVVLDIGGHIGCFSALAVNAGAKKVVYIEPGGPSVKFAAKNLAPAMKAGIVEVFYAGITADPDQKDMILRYFADGGSMAGAKTVTEENTKREHWRGKTYTYERVAVINFAKLVKDRKPKVIKLDTEGLEYSCIKSMKTMPASVKVMIVEWHKTGGRFGIQSYIECTAKLREWGFVPDREPNLKIAYNDKKEAIGSNQFFIRPIAWRR